MSQSPKPWRELPKGEAEEAKAGALLRGLSVEPSASARARVWQRLSEERKPDLAWLKLTGAAALAGAALAAVIFLRPNEAPSDAEQGAIAIARVAGEVSVGSEEAKIGTQVEQSTRVRTSAASATTLNVARLGRIDLASSSDLSIQPEEKDTRVALLRGTLRAEVESPSQTLIIEVESWTIRATAARFQLSRAPDDEVSVTVERGTVSVDGPRRLQLSAPARFDSSTLGPQAALEPMDEAEPEPEVEAEVEPEAETRPTRHAKRRRRHRRRPRVHTPAVQPSEPTTPEDQVEATVEDEPRPQTERTPEPGAPQLTPAAPADQGATPAIPAAPEPTPAIPPTPAPRAQDHRATAPVPTPEPPPSAEEMERRLYNQATSERDSARAIRLFDQVAELRGAHHEIARHQAARLLMKLGRYSAAAGRYESILRDFAKGALDHEARLDLLECRIKLGQTKRAQQTLDQLIQSHPDSERLPELHFLRAEILRLGGRTASACPEYRAALKSKYRGDALYLLGWCLFETGQRSDAEDTLEDYLDEYEDGRHSAEAQKLLDRLP